eukprot:c29139_g1_i6 orf=505-987(-)
MFPTPDGVFFSQASSVSYSSLLASPLERSRFCFDSPSSAESFAHFNNESFPNLRKIHGNKTDESIHPTAPVPKGYAAVYVGMTERRRFLIPVLYLNHPALQRLLQKAEEEFGFQQKGGLTLPCSVSDFESRLQLVDKEEHERPCFFASLLHFKLHSSFVC